MDSFLAK